MDLICATITGSSLVLNPGSSPTISFTIGALAANANGLSTATYVGTSPSGCEGTGLWLGYPTTSSAAYIIADAAGNYGIVGDATTTRFAALITGTMASGTAYYASCTSIGSNNVSGTQCDSGEPYDRITQLPTASGNMTSLSYQGNTAGVINTCSQVASISLVVPTVSSLVTATSTTSVATS